MEAKVGLSMDEVTEGLIAQKEEQDISSHLKSLVCSRYFFKALFLGQFISLLLCGTAVSTGLLQKQGVNIPTAQCFLNYVLLCLVFTTILSCRKEGRSLCEILRGWGWRYILIAIVDVEANYLVVKAYSYTTVTSVQLLDCFSLVIVMILSRIFLHARYRVQHLGGAAFCLLGMLGLVLTDVFVGKTDNSASNVALGDVLIIAGATLYGVSNVCEEYVVRKYDKVEFLAMVGLFGSFINGAQFAIFERDEVTSLDLTSYKTVVPLIVFVICLFLLYSTMTVVIQLTSATAVNLSLLSADFYTLLFGLFIFNYKFHVLYFVAFAVIIIGLTIYSTTPTNPSLHADENDTITSPAYSAAQTSPSLHAGKNDMTISPAYSTTQTSPSLHAGDNDMITSPAYSATQTSPSLHAGDNDMTTSPAYSTTQTSPSLHAGDNDMTTSPAYSTTQTSPSLHAGDNDMTTSPAYSTTQTSPSLHAGNNDMTTSPAYSTTQTSPSLHAGDNDMTTSPAYSTTQTSPSLHTGDNDMTTSPAYSTTQTSPSLHAGDNDMTTSPAYSTTQTSPSLHAGNNDMTTSPAYSTTQISPSLHAGDNDMTTSPTYSTTQTSPSLHAGNNDMTTSPAYSTTLTNQSIHI